MKRLGLVLSVVLAACAVDPSQGAPSVTSHESTTATEAEPCPLGAGKTAGCVESNVVRCTDGRVTSRQSCPAGCEGVVTFASDQSVFDIVEPSDYQCIMDARDAGDEPYDAGLRNSIFTGDGGPDCLEHHAALITEIDGDSCDHEPPTCAADGRTLLVCIQADGEASGVWLPSPCDCTGGCTARQYDAVEVHACIGAYNVEIADRGDGVCPSVDDREFCRE